MIDRFINKRKSEQNRYGTPPENGTINRELALLKSAFNHGTEQTPPKVRFVPHFNMLEEKNIRRGFLQDEQYLRLSRECPIEGVWLSGLFETAYSARASLAVTANETPKNKGNSAFSLRTNPDGFRIADHPPANFPQNPVYGQLPDRRLIPRKFDE